MEQEQKQKQKENYEAISKDLGEAILAAAREIRAKHGKLTGRLVTLNFFWEDETREDEPFEAYLCVEPKHPAQSQAVPFIVGNCGGFLQALAEQLGMAGKPEARGEADRKVVLH